MAVTPTFKQPCPSCEAMVTIKESMVGKKVECTKCKDKFIAKKPSEEKKSTGITSKKDTTLGKKNTALQKKVGSAVSAKAPPPGKKTKMVVEDVEEIEELELEDEAPVQTKSSKSKSTANGKSKPEAAVKSNGKGKKPKVEEEVDDEDDHDHDDEDDQKDKKKNKKKSSRSNKLTMGLALAVVGVIFICVAAFFLLRGPRPNTGQVAANPGGGTATPVDKGGNASSGTGGDKTNPNTGTGTTKSGGKKPGDATLVPLTDAEIANLTNLLPGDTEHVFHGYFKELLSSNLPLSDSAFRAGGALDDADIRKKVGFSVLAIDDLIRAERYTIPSWTYTVIHFKELLREEDLEAALKLKAVTVDGQTYYQMREANPWFEQMGRFSFALPTHLQAFNGSPADRQTCLRIHNQQTLIVGDEVPIVALLKAKGRFPMNAVKEGPGPVTPPNPDPGVGPNPNPMPTGMMGGVPNPMPMPTGMMGGNTLPMPKSMQLPSPSGMMGGSPPPPPRGMMGGEMMGGGMMGGGMMGGIPNPMPTGMMGGVPNPMPTGMMGGIPNPMPNPNPDPTPAPAANSPRDSMYLTIKPHLKAVLDRMEFRPTDNRDKVLLSSSTDMMEASVDGVNVTDIKDYVLRRPRELWDVSLMLRESRPRIRTLGTALLQKDAVRFQYRNELNCGMEVDAKEFHKEMADQTALNVATFIFKITGHAIRVAGDNPPPKAKDPVPNPMPNPMPKPPDEKNPPQEQRGSQISLNLQGTTVEFVMDLQLDNPTLKQIMSVTSFYASKLRVDMEVAASVSSRHLLATAGMKLGTNGLSKRNVPPGTFPPGAFPSQNAVGHNDEPKHRISWMAGLLPYMGQQRLFDKIAFEQPWRDSGNWQAGQTMVPQFHDPTYPEYTRFVQVGNLPLEYGTTHFVGIAGVGLDAASYKRNHLATKRKQGAFSYDGSANLEEIGQARGTANMILMLQVPHDSITGVSPWIAGGGATLRGVPEQNSIAPFVSQHQNKRGTFALMADGTVRFIGQNVSDEVFKTMCTVGEAPVDLKLNNNPNTPLIVPTKNNKKGEKPDDSPPPKKEPVKKAPAPAEKTSQLAPTSEPLTLHEWNTPRNRDAMMEKSWRCG